MAGEQTEAFITKGRSAGMSDMKIFLKMMDHPTFSPFVKKMNAQGMNNRQIAEGIGLNISNEAVDLPKMQQDSKRAQAKEQGKTRLWESGLLGFSDLGAGVVQGALYAKDAITGGDSYKKFTNSRKDIEDNHNLRRQENSQGYDWGRLGGNIVSMPVAPVGTGGVMAVAGRGALTGAGIGAASFAKDADHRMMNTALGGVGGGVGGAVGKKIGDVAVRGHNAATNNLRSGAKEIIEQGEKYGVRTSVGDAGQNPHIRRTETVLDRVPFIGTSKFREAQQKEVAAAADNVVEKLRTKMTETDYKSLGKIQSAANAGDQNAIRIMQVVNEAGSDSKKILQAAAEVKNWRGKKMASDLYDRVGAIAGNQKIPITNALKAMDDVIAADSKTIPNKELLSKLNKIKQNWVDPANPQNFRELKAMRSSLGDLMKKWGRDGLNTKPLTKIRTAINNDLADFANSSGNPQLIREFGRANSFYKNLKESQGKSFAQSMSTNEPDQILNTFVKMGKGDKAANFYKNLDPKGQAALRFEMANRALDKATHESTGVFSPAKFAQEFERMREPYSSIFGKADKAQMDGFVKLMRHVENAGQYSSNPTNGSMLLLPASGIGLASSAVTNPIETMFGVGGIYGMSKLFTTNAGKRILLASKDLPLNSPKFANLIKQIEKLALLTGANISDQ